MPPADLISHEYYYSPIEDTRTEKLHFENFCFLIQKLSEQCCTINMLEQIPYKHKERKIIHNVLSTTVLQAQVLIQLEIIRASKLQISYKSLVAPPDTQHLLLNCKYYCDKLWKALSIPAPIFIRHQIATFLSLLDDFTSRFVFPLLETAEGEYFSQFSDPIKVTKPSVIEQITHLEVSIDPYQKSLSHNYYYPLSLSEMSTPEAETEQTLNSPNTRSGPIAPPQPTIVTVEDSMEVIDELIQELQASTEQEMTDATVSPEQDTVNQLNQPSKASTIRFSLYRTQASRITKDNNTYLPLFKLFLKCILSTNPNTKILPIQINSKVSAITTTNQITELSQIGATNYVKGSRGSKTLAGDYHISTPLSFEELQSDSKVASWLGLNGYKLIYNECQTSDMVLIGFLTRVRPFTWRDDLKQAIMTSEEWKQYPFHFRLYFGTFSSNIKGTMTPVMMVEIDRPNIDQGLKFFKETFDGDNHFSSCDIPYVFFSLYKNRFTEDERAKIVYDNELHMRQVSTIHMQGIKDVDTIVTLKQNVKVKLRKVLLSLRAPETSSGKFFIQIEKQNDAEWLTCAFHTTDAERVTANLHKISLALSQCIIPEDLDKVFCNQDHKLVFVTKTIPIKKGNLHIASKPIATETQAHTTKMLSKLSMPIPKRSTQDESGHNTTNSKNTNKAWMNLSASSNATFKTVELNQNSNNFEANTSGSEAERRFTILEQSVLQGSERMDRLETICTQLMHNTEIIGNQIQKLAMELYKPESPGCQTKPSKAAKLS
jgi:hypothetical protein